MYLERTSSNRIKELFSSFPAVVIIGARQVGKSTLLLKLFSKVADYVVFDPAVDIENARRDPDLFLNNHRIPIILDEIQYAPEVVSALKRRIDKNKNAGQYLITGSQQWGVLKSISESLAGRAALCNLDTLTLAEISGEGLKRPWLLDWMDDTDAFIRQEHKRLQPRFMLYEQLWRGMYPEAQFLDEPVITAFNESYLRTYIERDARMMAEISDWQAFGRFIRLCAALTGQEINHSQLGRELGLTPQTAKRWIDILSATFQWYEIFPFSGNTIKRVSGRPKGYIADSAIACLSLSISSPSAIAHHPAAGAIFESAVAAEIRKMVNPLPGKAAIYHWRSHGGAEVDIVLERNGVLYPIEIKLTTSPSRRDTTGISAFRETYPKNKIAPGLVIAPVEKMIQLSENDYAVPWDCGLI